MDYTPPLNGDLEDPARPHVNANIALGIDGSRADATGYQAMMMEIVNAITTLGSAPDGEDFTQLGAAIVNYIGTQTVAPVYSTGASPGAAHSVSASLTAPRDGYVVAIGSMLSGGGGGTLATSLTINGVACAGDIATNLYSQTQVYVFAATAGQVVNGSYSVGETPSSNTANILMFFTPAS